MRWHNARVAPMTKDAVEDKDVGPTQRLFQRDFMLLMVINFLVMTAVTTQMGTLPLYVTQLGGHATIAGLVVGIWGLSALVARIPVGKIIDRFGRKQLVLIGLFILAADFSLLIFYSALVGLVVLRALQGVGNGTQSTAVATMVADQLPPQKLSVGLGYFSISQTLPAAIGPAIGLFFVNRWGFQSLFYFNLTLVLIALSCTFFVHESYERPVQENTTIVMHQPFGDLLFQVEVWVPSLIIFVASFANAAVAAFLVQFGYEKHLPLTLVGLSFTVQAIIGVGARLWFAQLYQAVETVVLIASSIVLIASAYLLIAWSQGVFGLLIAGGLDGLGFALLMPLLNGVVLGHVLPMQRGRATAIFSSGNDVAYGMGAILWGVFASCFGYFWLYCCAASLVLATLYLIWRYRQVLQQAR